MIPIRMKKNTNFTIEINLMNKVFYHSKDCMSGFISEKGKEQIKKIKDSRLHSS